jgi:palmitoyltransferase
MFVLTLSVAIAVMILLSWHVYLVLSAQTTIEFYGNRSKASKLRVKGIFYHNPYDLGWARNWQQVFGNSHPLIAILPSRRPPPWPPWPQHSRASLRM